MFFCRKKLNTLFEILQFFTIFSSHKNFLETTLKCYEPRNVIFNFKNFKKSNVNFSKQFFYDYLKLNFFIPYQKLTPHASYNIYYIYNNATNAGFINLKRFFQVWVIFITFLENIFYYNIKLLYFFSPYFRTECLALNYSVSALFANSWRYSKLFYFFVNNTISREFTHFLFFLKLKSLHFTMFVDIFYHKTTLHFFSLNNFVTIGPVPITTNLYTLNIAIPIASNTLISNLFFIRLIFKLKQLNERYIYFFKKSLWKFL